MYMYVYLKKKYQWNKKGYFGISILFVSADVLDFKIVI